MLGLVWGGIVIVEMSKNDGQHYILFRPFGNNCHTQQFFEHCEPHSLLGMLLYKHIM